MKLLLPFLVLLVGCAGNTNSTPPIITTTPITTIAKPVTDSLRFMYVGNMGVLMAYQKQAVLIDGFHKKYKPEYLHPSKSLVSALMSGDLKGYPALNAVLFTHAHKDHFSARYAHLFRYSNPNTALLGASQITAATAELDTEKRIDTKALTTIPYDGETHKTTINNDLSIQAFRCDHSWAAKHGAMQNIAYIVTLGDYRILHVGDTDWEMASPIFEKHQLKAAKIDVAILPYWMLQPADAVANVKQYLGEVKVVGTHINPAISEEEKAGLQAAYPDALLFIDAMEEEVF